MTETLLLILVALAGGFITSAGVYSLITVVGIVPRLGAKSRTGSKMQLYEWCIIFGGTLGNIFSLFQPDLHLWAWMAVITLVMFGLFSGIFIGCLVMALAESLEVVPILCRRIRLSVGIQYLIIAFAIGKVLGALMFFYLKWQS